MGIHEPGATEPDTLQERATALLGELILTVEQRAAPELADLRDRIDRALTYMECVAKPNVHTLSHIRRMLTGQQ